MLQTYLSDCDEFNDGSSEYSETTMASEFVERQIKIFNNDLRSEPQASSNNNDRIQVVNFRVDTMNIRDGGNL